MKTNIILKNMFLIGNIFKIKQLIVGRLLHNLPAFFVENPVYVTDQEGLWNSLQG